MMNFGRRAIRLKYQTLYDSHLWRESLRVISGILDPSLNGIFFLPYDTEEVVFFSVAGDGTNFSRLNYRERDWLERHATSQVSIPGSAISYYRAENLAWSNFNPGQFTFTSYDTTIFTLFIAGTDASGNMVNETFKMQAIVNPGDQSINPAVVTTVNSYTQVTALSKGVTNKPLIVQPQFPPASPPLSMPPGLSELVFTQLVLTPPPIFGSNSIAVRLQVKLKADTLGSDNSVPRISHIMDALTEFVLAAMYKKARQLNKADNSEQKGIAHIQAAVNIEKNQSEMRQQVVPIIYEPGDYLGTNMVTRATSSYPWGW